MNSLFFAYLHHIAAFALVASLVIELVLIRQDLNFGVAKTLRVVDAVYGVSAGVLLLVGGLRVMYYEKGVDYYLKSTAFWWKIGLFSIVGILSIYPTVLFLKWSQSMRAGHVPVLTVMQRKRLTWILSLELMVLALLPWFAYAMAHGSF